MDNTANLRLSFPASCRLLSFRRNAEVFGAIITSTLVTPYIRCVVRNCVIKAEVGFFWACNAKILILTNWLNKCTMKQLATDDQTGRDF